MPSEARCSNSHFHGPDPVPLGEIAAAARRDLERRQDDLRPLMRRLEARERELDTIERSLDEREDVLEKRAEERLWQLIDAALARGLGERLESR